MSQVNVIYVLTQQICEPLAHTASGYTQALSDSVLCAQVENWGMRRELTALNLKAITRVIHAHKHA